ncbi:unnamed protein product [Dicrocoelium dendriticum]|nr:unnamed protein product [Dicrocoelium dendriticum]
MPEDPQSVRIKAVESVLQDYKTLILETRRKYAPIKEAAEKQAHWLRSRVNSNEDLNAVFSSNIKALLSPFLSGCGTRQQKIVVVCLTACQKLINNEFLTEDGAEALIDALSQLVEARVEELRVLQTTILLITTSPLVRSKLLAKSFVLCLRLYESKVTSTVNTAAAAVRQCACSVFERVLKEEGSLALTTSASKIDSKILLPEDIVFTSPNDLTPTALDAYNLFKDICSLLNDEPPTWLFGCGEINLSLGLELLESVISLYTVLFRQHVAFAYLLKASLCPLVIKLFSPSIKIRPSVPITSSGLTETASSALAAAATAVVNAGGAMIGSTSSLAITERGGFPVMVRLKRLISVIVMHYFDLLITECEIYLSLLIRLLDVDKIIWQRALALEILQKICAQPSLIRHMCVSYDMRVHSIKIFSELVNSLSHYVQTVLANPSSVDALNKEPQLAGGTPVVYAPNQSLLYYRGSFFSIAQPKSLLTDLLDRSEPPTLQDSYCLSVAFFSLMHIVNSLAVVVQGPPGSEFCATDSDVREQAVVLSWCGLLPVLSLLLEASADEQITCDILQAIHTMVGLCGGLRIEVARDAFVTVLCKSALPSSSSTKFPLFSAQTKANLHAAPPSPHDDVFERSPVVIAVTLGAGHSVNVTTKVGSSSLGASQAPGASTPASSSSNSESVLSASGGSLLLTAKHLQSSRAVLHAAMVHGNVLGGSWDIILGTLQNLAWMLDLKIDSRAKLFFKPPPVLEGGSCKTADATPYMPCEPSSTSRPGISAHSPSVAQNLSDLSSMMSTLFLQSSQLEGPALSDMVLGLCQLSAEAAEFASANKDPSRFSLSKLTEVGLVNTHRLDMWWDNVCCQLLSMCKLSHTELRRLAASSLVTLVKQAVAAPQTPEFWKNEVITSTVLDPLSSLSEAPFDDVREMQLGCVQHMLHCYGDQIGSSWLRLIEIIGVIRDSFRVDQIHTAFQCFKLIVTDYLSSLLPDCYTACVTTAARFGHQQQDLNIALSAIGTILHLADYLLEKENCHVSTDPSTVVTIHELWIGIFSQLSGLCLDPRPAVRKSACQTLFNMIECHGARRFTASTWTTMFWKILFPLVTNVLDVFVSAPCDRDEQQNILLMHHSRDTASKQWAETVALTLSGTTRLFISKQDILLPLNDFPQIWSALLHQIKLHALTENAEISVTALTSMQTLLELQPDEQDWDTILWPPAWETWLQIASHAVHLRGIQRNLDNASTSSAATVDNAVAKDDSNYPSVTFLPSTAFLTLLFDLFAPLFHRIRVHFTHSDLTRVEEIIRLGVLTPLHVSCLYSQTRTNSPPLNDDGALSPAQESLLRCLDNLLQNTRSPDSHLSCHLPAVLRLLLTLSALAVEIPKLIQGNLAISVGTRLVTVVPPNYILFAEKCLRLAIDAYLAITHWSTCARAELLEDIIKTLHKPMSLKYACSSQSTWLLASHLFCQVTPTLISILTTSEDLKPPDALVRSLCDEVAQTLHDSLFCQHKPPSSLSIKGFQCQEDLDCKLVNLISDCFLSSPVELPDHFIAHLVRLLSLGSIQASSTLHDGTVKEANGSDLNDANGSSPIWCTLTNNDLHDSSHTEKRPKVIGMAVRQTDFFGCDDPLVDSAMQLHLDLDRLRQYTFRENFARLCFNKLLSHAFAGSPLKSPTIDLAMSSSAPAAPISVSRAAIQSILQRCRSVLIRFYQSSQLTGKCPLPRVRLIEISYVFKALTVMLTSLQSAFSRRNIDPSTWNHVIELYPHIVDCVLVIGGSPMTAALHRLLQLYGELLRSSSLPDEDTTHPSTRI